MATHSSCIARIIIGGTIAEKPTIPLAGRMGGCGIPRADACERIDRELTSHSVRKRILLAIVPGITYLPILTMWLPDLVPGK